MTSNAQIQRKSYARIPNVLPLPRLTEIQLNSFEWFKGEGLRELFDEISPIVSFNHNLELHFGKFWFGESKYSEQECRERDMTFAAPLWVRVQLRIKEGANERVQEFRGTVIRTRSGGNNANFTVRRIASNGIGVERTFLVRSPRLEKVLVERHSAVRRARLYFLRERTGKSARLKQKFS